MSNPMPADEIKYDSPESQTGPALDELYDDLPPADQSRPGTLGSLLVSALMRELNSTMEDVNKITAFFEEIEQNMASRKTVSGEVIQSSFTESFIQALKRTGINETLREQLIRLQTSPFRANLEAALRQYWEELRRATTQLQTKVKQQVQSVRPSVREEYQPEQPVVEATQAPATAPAYSTIRPAEVAPATPPTRELVVDIFDEATSGEIVLVVEHAGLQANSIRVNLDHDIVTLRATDLNDQEYSKECLLPAPVELNSFAQQYRNGVLEIRFKRI